MQDLLYEYAVHKLRKNKPKPQGVDEITGFENIDKIIDIDQSPIGRTPRSNPATYTDLFTHIRELFAKTNESKVRGYKAKAKDITEKLLKLNIKEKQLLMSLI